MRKTPMLTKLGIRQEIERYIKTLIEHKITPQKVILFGSFVKDKYSAYSDIDLAIISNQFGRDPVEEMMALSRLTLTVSDRIEAIPLTEKDMKLHYHTLIGEIKKYGKIVYQSK